MLTTLLVLQVIIAVAMVVVILVQRSSSDGLAGLSGGSGGGNSLISGRASANLLTKTTAILATAFMVNSLAMATISARKERFSETIVEDVVSEEKKAEPVVPIAE